MKDDFFNVVGGGKMPTELSPPFKVRLDISVKVWHAIVVGRGNLKPQPFITNK